MDQQIETLPPISFFCAPFLAYTVPFPRMLFFLFICHKLVCPSDSLYVLHPPGRVPDCSLSTLAWQKSPFPLQCHHPPGHTPLPPATLITHVSISGVELFECRDSIHDWVIQTGQLQTTESQEVTFFSIAKPNIVLEPPACLEETVDLNSSC